MAPPIQSSKDDQETPSNNLWIGNLSADVSDADLMELFTKYGALGSVTTYSSRNYAFVFFKRVEDAKAAKDALQGAAYRGNQLKIEFARPAKPCKSLWVGGISPSVLKEELEEEFQKFGKIEEFKFLRDRNTAFVDFATLEDASQAMRNLNGKHVGGEQIRVDFLRSQPSRREQWHNSHDPRDDLFLGRGLGPSDAHSGMKKSLSHAPGGRKIEGQPSNVLWIGYPPSVLINEEMLHNALILFGEIERIKSFHDRHYSFVEFRSVDEARRAKEGLQGRLFNDPRITIMFSSSGLAPGKDYPALYPGIKGPRPEMFFNEHPFGTSQLDMFGHGHPMLPKGFPGPLSHSAKIGSNIKSRPFGPQNSFGPLLSEPEFNELATIHDMQDANPPNMMDPNWRRPSPSAPGILPSPAQGIRPPIRPSSGSWDVYDANQFQRNSKRLRIDGSLSVDDTSFPSRNIDDHELLDQSFGLGPVIDGGGLSGPFVTLQGKNPLSPVGTKVRAGGPGLNYSDNDYIWRGIIAKGGTPVCHARCVPRGKGIGTELPNVVNCSARTGLDMLTKHYAEAIGFDIVFFLPDSEDDFASYTEFLRYLGGKNRAGVAKLDDGTTLFLVPPSDFLTNVLKVTGPERLYGVVLKLPQQAPSSGTIQQESHHSVPFYQYTDRRPIPSTQADYIHTREDQFLPMDYNRSLHEDSKPLHKPHFPPTVESSSALQSFPRDGSNNSTAAPQAGVTLTPELVATLSSFLPAHSQSSALEGAQPVLGSSTIRPSFPQSVGHSNGTPLQGWNKDHQAAEPAGHSLQQVGNQFHSQGQVPQMQHYRSASSTPSHSAQMILGSTQFQDSTVSISQQGAPSSRPVTTFSIPSQSALITPSPSVSQQYQLEVPSNTQKGYGMAHGTDASGLYGSSIFQQTNNPTTMPNQVYGANFSQAQNHMPSGADQVNLELPNQMQQLQSVLSGAGQSVSEVESDKNQRYQSTLQFAANLLLQLQQQQQQQQQQQSGNQL
ncbi:RRM_1 domain-containing protein/SPOC domain-containing protein/RRM_5 domain-containing protein [Cephalotus follicularis]|uniref:RRM_1 domain-containing protein/SPOC domain-containing protein/RRM_5 domain-containing protein n=1 Tax=Cephalotus follicularis TaxID=3775 RepID=A0A1Q3B8D9_CEPFO|nr:RRM_1 domain-containing protein/SPOC domain-containing protein/RRM_5 domain-containing protein [Cephalotus follicularis]